MRCFIFYKPFTGSAPFLHCLPATAYPLPSPPPDQACFCLSLSLFPLRDKKIIIITQLMWLRLKSKLLKKRLQSKTSLDARTAPSLFILPSRLKPVCFRSQTQDPRSPGSQLAPLSFSLPLTNCCRAQCPCSTCLTTFLSALQSHAHNGAYVLCLVLTLTSLRHGAGGSGGSEQMHAKDPMFGPQHIEQGWPT